MTIEAGGRVFSTNGIIGGGSFSTGRVTVADSGSTWMVNGQLTIGTSKGTLNIDPGATVDVAEDTVLFSGGLLRLHGGALATTGIGFEGGGGEFDWTDGTLHVGQFNGDLTNPNGGTLAPGRSAGETTITGDYTHQAAATLEIEIGGLASATEHDHVTVGGNLLLGGGELRLTLLDDFVPDVLHTFTILDFDGDIFGQFDNVAGGERLDTADGLGSFVVHYGPTSMFNPNQIVLTSFEASATIPGDFDLDGDVDGQDFLLWQRGESPNSLSAADLAEWEANYGTTAPLSKTVAAVPEPNSLPLLICCGMFALGLQRRQVPFSLRAPVMGAGRSSE